MQLGNINYWSLFNLRFASTAKNFPPLGKHVQVHLREQRNVEQHDQPQEVEVREGEVVGIWHFDAPLLGFSDVALRPIETQQFSRYSNRVEYDEGRVSEEDDEMWNGVHEIQSIVAVTDDFRNRPSEQG